MDLFCTECKYSAMDDHSEKLVCRNDKNMVEFFNQAKYLATGVKDSPRMVMRGSSAESLRADRGGAINLTTCGPEAKWFEKKVAQ